MAVATGSANAMKVSLGIPGEIEVDNDVDSLDIDASSEKVRADKIAANAVAEIVEYAVSV